MESKFIYVIIFLISVFISSVSQIILKKSANKTYDSKIKEYMNAPVIIAYALFFGASMLTVLAYRGVPLSMGAILEATGYVWVSLLGMLILKEKLERRKVIGLAVIILGVLIFNAGEFL